ncbi:MAG: SDR family NAD(P)-dependent oxidoreductase [Myxococcota bacterium]
MRGTIVLVTGATDGIGRQTALELARLGAQVVLHGRSEARALEAQQAILKDVPKAELSLAVADLSMPSEIRAMTERLSSTLPRLDVLINNAGVFMKQRVLTKDGLETTFMVNHLAPILLTHGLLGLLRRSAPARLVNVSSIAHQRAALDFNNLQGEARFDGYGAYAVSKLGNVLFTNALARRIPAAEIGAFSLHPGVIGTKLLRTGFGMGGADLTSGAKTSVFAATNPELAGLTGLYLSDGRVTTASAMARDVETQERLWKLSMGMLGVDWA